MMPVSFVDTALRNMRLEVCWLQYARPMVPASPLTIMLLNATKELMERQ